MCKALGGSWECRRTGFETRQNWAVFLAPLFAICISWSKLPNFPVPVFFGKTGEIIPIPQVRTTLIPIKHLAHYLK